MRREILGGTNDLLYASCIIFESWDPDTDGKQNQSYR